MRPYLLAFEPKTFVQISKTGYSDRDLHQSITTEITLGIRTLLVTLAVTTLPSAHVQRALPVYISAILFKLSKYFIGYILWILLDICCIRSRK